MASVRYPPFFFLFFLFFFFNLNQNYINLISFDFFKSGNTTVTQILRQSFREEGIRFLFKGWTPAFIRMGPNTVLLFVFYEVSLKKGEKKDFLFYDYSRELTTSLGFVATEEDLESYIQLDLLDLFFFFFFLY